jgi:peptidyl-prolyl cis-trans isomerase SurA
MQRITGIGLAALFCLVGAVGASRADEIITDGIAAQVGNDIVLISEVLDRVADLEKRLRDGGAPPQEIAKLRAAGLEKLIESRLIDQIVERGELYATDDEINQALDTIAVENGLTREQLKQSVESQGLPFDEYRDEIKSSIEHQKVIRSAVASKITVEESDLKKLYDERFADQPEGGEMVHLRQILVTFGEVVPADEREACAEVHAARKRIVDGESFEKVASEVSEVAPADGGDIGWLHSDSLATWMTTLVDPLKEGETSDVVKLPFGCSLLKLVERESFEPITFEEAKPQLQVEVYQAKLEVEFRKWMEELRSQTFIERKGHFADAARLGSKSGYAGSDDDAGDSLF